MPFNWWKRKDTANGSAAPGAGGASSSLIDLRQVVKVYQSAAGSYQALKGIDLQVGAGEFVGIIGKSGSGKSTLVNMLTGIDRPTSGEVYVAGTPVHKLSEGQTAVWRGRHLGIVFQFFQLLPSISIIQNIMLPMDFRSNITPRQRRERAMMLLDQVGMAQHAYKLPSAVSGGQQQRVAIARALANDPPILIADEPTGNLDSKTAESVFQLFEGLVRGGKTIFMVTHDNDFAQRVSRSVLVVDGQVVNQYVTTALARLDVDGLSEVFRQLERRRFASGAIIFRQGDPADRFYIITRGHVEVMIKHPIGHDIVVATLGPGQFFGEGGMMQGTPRSATIRARLDGEVETMVMDRAAFAAMMESSEATKKEFAEIVRARMFESMKATTKTGILDESMLEHYLRRAAQ